MTSERPPSVDAVYRRIEAQCTKYPRELVMVQIRRGIEKIRTGSRKASDLDSDVLQSLEELSDLPSGE